ncbi:MAG: hypothetical protein ACK2UU_24000 [Anaerolineae bacterium]|jgi:uncharacterized membrane protein required for colicin V production
MIPVEYLWLALILVFGITGMVRGLWKELGVTTVLLLSLFVLTFGWEQIGSKIVAAVPGNTPTATIMAIYYIIPIIFVSFIAYEGITLKFPMREMKGILKGLLGLPGGLLNGYLIVGTIWDVVNRAGYFGLEVPLGSSGATVAIADSLTKLNSTLVQYLPVTFMNEYVMLLLGMILLVAIILK